MSCTAPLTSKHCILYIYSTYTGTEYFKQALYSPFFSLQNAVCFIMLTCLVPVLFTFYIQGVLKLKKNNSGSKGLNTFPPPSFHGLFFIPPPYTKQPISGTPAFCAVLVPVSLLSCIARPHTVHSSTTQMKDAPGACLPNYTVPHSTATYLHTHSWKNIKVHVFKMNVLTNNIT